MGKRSAVTAADLFVLLDREFRRRKPRDCDVCFVQLPYRVDMRDASAANWEIVLPPHCGNGCESMLQELVSEFQGLYDLKVNDRG